VNQDGAAILDLKAGIISTLNPTGAVIWQSLERGEGTETIAQSLAGQTGEDIETVRKDVADFVLGYHLKTGHTLSVQNRPTGLA
jgi:hypothetical protein